MDHVIHSSEKYSDNGLVSSAVDKQKNDSLQKQNDRSRNIAPNGPIEMSFYLIFGTQVNWISSSPPLWW